MSPYPKSNLSLACETLIGIVVGVAVGLFLNGLIDQAFKVNQ